MGEPEVTHALDRYEVLAPLGSGGFGSVFRARHRHTGREVALKVSDPGGDPELVARALNEARMTASITHPCLVQVFDCGALPDGRVFVAMERIEGETLDALLDREGARIAPERAIAIGMQVLSALDAVHAHGIVHRDVKPANVLVRRNGPHEHVYLIDFGISKATAAMAFADNGTKMGAVLGTPGYMAPEQLDARSVDARADVYGVAALLYRAIAGRQPYEAASFGAWMSALAAGPPPPLATLAPWVSPALAHVIDRGLARDRDARLPSAKAMRDALEAAWQGAYTAPTMHATVRVPAEPVPMPTAALGERPKRARFVAIALAIAALFAVVGIAIVFGLTREPRGEDEVAEAASAAAATSIADKPLVSASEPEVAEVAPAEVEREATTPTSPMPRPETTPRPATPAATVPASDVPEPVTATTRRVRFVSATPVGNIEMDEVMGFIRRATPRIQRCYEGDAPTEVRLWYVFRTGGAPMVSPMSDQSEVGRCASTALSSVIGGGTRSFGILRDVVFAWR